MPRICGIDINAMLSFAPIESRDKTMDGRLSSDQYSEN